MARRIVGTADDNSDNVVFVGDGTWYANPFRAYEHCVGEDWGVVDTGRLHTPMGHGWTEVGARKAAVASYRAIFEDAYPEHRAARFGLAMDLRGKDLACTCPDGVPCHGDVLIAAVNTDDPFYDISGLDQS
jgi:hypothetical protein